MREKKMRPSPSSVESLPEELLIKIISLLNLKEAVRTSVISRQWKDLWKYIPNLVIDASNVLSFKTKKTLKASLRQQLADGERLSNGVSREVTDEFINVANSILHSHRGSFESLVLRFFLKGNHFLCLDKWISLAATSRTKKLVVNLQSPYKARYNFPYHIFSSEGGGCFLENLELKSCSLELPIQNLNEFKNLTTLRLESVRVVDKVIRDLLSKFVALKDLHFISCNELFYLEVPSSLYNLEDLEVFFCDNLIKVECHAPSLSNFEYSGQEVFLNIKTLEKASICLDEGSSRSKYVIDHLPRAIASVKTLELQMDWSLEVLGKPYLQHRFVHLKYLELVDMHADDIYSAIGLVNAAPFLETFVMEIWGAKFVRDSEKVGTIPKCLHNCLKRVNMVGFTGYKGQLEVLSFLLANATQLEEMTIDTSTRCSKEGSELKVSQAKIEIARKIFAKRLQHLVPEQVKLLIL